MVVRKMPQNERKRRVGEMLEVMHFESLADRNITQLSSGPNQRFALTRAIAPRLPEASLLSHVVGAGASTLPCPNTLAARINVR
jgi:ABC-type sulfate/molybdate transport systems ATPase subunit